MQLKVGRIYKGVNGAEVEILKTGITHQSGPQYSAVGILTTGQTMYFSNDGTCPGSPQYNLQIPKKTGWVRVCKNESGVGLTVMVPFEYVEDEE